MSGAEFRTCEQDRPWPSVLEEARAFWAWADALPLVSPYDLRLKPRQKLLHRLARHALKALLSIRSRHMGIDRPTQATEPRKSDLAARVVEEHVGQGADGEPGQGRLPGYGLSLHLSQRFDLGQWVFAAVHPSSPVVVTASGEAESPGRDTVPAATPEAGR